MYSFVRTADDDDDEIPETTTDNIVDGSFYATVQISFIWDSHFG